jgi:hypothetical protein
MPEQTRRQVVFAGVDAQSASHLLAEDRVQTATNVDFDLQRGAATVRRGCSSIANWSTATPVDLIYRHYNNPSNIGVSPVYTGLSALGGVVRGTGWGTAAYTGVAGTYSLGTSGAAIGSYKRHAYIAIGTRAFKDDGTAASVWVYPTPATPTVTINTLTALTVCNTWTVSEGTLAGGTSTATGTTDSSSYRLCFTGVPVSTNLNSNGGLAIDDWGVDYLDILFSNPSYVVKVSRDYSIGDTSFNSYFHTEYDLEFADEVNPSEVFAEAELLLDAQIAEGTATSSVLDSEERAEVVNDARVGIRSPIVRISAAANTFNAWGVSRPNFELVGKVQPTAGASLWANIGAVRVVVEATRVCEVQIRSWEIKGAKTYPLNDAQVGYAWWQTFAKISGGVVLFESPASPISARYKVQHSQAKLVNGVPSSWGEFTHAIYYRQGGYIQTPYAVGTSSISDGTAAPSVTTFTDSLTDIEVLSQGPTKKLNVNLYEQTNFPNNISAISEPFFGSLFFSATNTVFWSNLGKPEQIPFDNYVEVSHTGDEVQKLITYPTSLVIVNRDSVFELGGSVFTGRSANYVLQRSNSIRGSKAKGSVVKTPYGIPLLDYDGLYFYQPSQGVDIQYPWIEAKIKDAFKGAGGTDPAANKGSRIPAINKSYIINSQAAFYDNKLFLAVPTGSDQYAKTVFVINFNTQDCYWYSYPFFIRSMFWDFVDNCLMVGTSEGAVVQLEANNDKDFYSVADALANANIVWTIKTGAFTTKSDTRIENLHVEYQGSNASAFATLDGVTTSNLGTLTNTVRDWVTKSVVGTIANNIVYEVTGTKTSSGVNIVYGMEWDSLPEPKRVQFYRTEHFINNYEGEKLWDVQFVDVELVCETGSAAFTLLGTVYIDETAVMTHTITGPTNGRKIFTKSFPSNTFGNVSYTIFNKTGGASSDYFKLWGERFSARNEPPRINSWKTDIQSLEEQICDAVDVDIAPNGTVTSTVFVDNTSVGTYTFTGTPQQSYTAALPSELYGRTIYAIHNGSAFKHYRTWFHLRQEPDRWTNFVTDKDIGDESIWDAMNYDINPLGGTAYGTVYVDAAVVTTATITGTNRVGGVIALPAETYGRAGWVTWNSNLSTTRFKHYKTWFDRRPEPDRVTNFVSDRESGNEKWWRTCEVDINPLGTVFTTAVVDGVAVGTFTSTGTGRKSYVHTLPINIYGRTVYAIHNSSSSSARLKHYRTWFEGTPEPDRLSIAQSDPQPYPSSQNLRTWVAELNPNGTCTGTVLADNTVLATATFTGTHRTTFNHGLDLDSSLVLTNPASVLRAVYTGTDLKHYSTQFETTPNPFGKKTWSILYKKIGGASQLDLARFWSCEIEPISGTATITSIWDIDGTAFHTNTLTFTRQEWRDCIPFPPGGRGQLFQQRLLSDVNIFVHKSNMDVMQVGIKGLTRRTIPGTPQ